jgi:hypothetical protein
MEIRWSKFSLEGERAPSRLALFILREIMSGAASFVRIRDTRREAVASFYVNIRFWAESRTWWIMLSRLERYCDPMLPP